MIGVFKFNSSFLSIEKFINSYDYYIFLGRNPLVSHSIDKFLEKKSIKRIDYKKDFKDLQYELVDDYISFIELNEEEDYKADWWKTRLSGKNPWISNFFLRFCQVKIVLNIIEKLSTFGKVIIIIEDTSVYYTIINHLNFIKFQFQILNKDNHFASLSLIIKGILRRIYSIPFYIYKFILFKLLFFSSSNRIFLKNKIFAYSFIDSRCFEGNKYSDPFIGKFLEKLHLNQSYSIIPVLSNVSLKSLIIFRKWLRKTKNSASFPYEYLSIKFLIEIFKIPPHAKKVVFHGIDVSHLISFERLEEWCDFSIHNELIFRISSIIDSQDQNKVIIYPFENQIWERFMISSFKNLDFNNLIIALQNAPCPKLSTRYFCSFKTRYKVPMPNLILTTGKISYHNLSKFWNKDKLNQFSTSRKIIELSTKANIQNKKNVMVACSISPKESIELILFALESLSKTSYNIFIVPHPLSRLNCSNLLRNFNHPSNITINHRYKDVMLKSKFILFDSSTAGIEGLMNGLVPIRVVHKHSLNVNPSEYDDKYTKIVYTKNQLLNILESNPIYNKKSKETALKYYISDDLNLSLKIKSQISRIIYD